MEDLLIGAAASVLVALLAWPRGAASSFRVNLAAAYTSASDYLRAAVDFAVDPQPSGRCAILRRASVAAEQLAEDALRGLLLERGSSFASPAEVVAALTVASSSREVADWMIDFSTHRRSERGTRVAAWAAKAIEARAGQLTDWQHLIADAVRSGEPVPTDPAGAGADSDSFSASAATVNVGGNDALPAWLAAQLDALSGIVRDSVPAISALPRR